jgi:hypothetical protein
MQKAKIFDYVVVLKNHHKEAIEKTGWLLSAFAVLPYAVAVYTEPKKWILIVLLFVLGGLLISSIIDKKRNKKIRFAPLLVISGMGLLFFSSIGLVGLFYLLAGAVEKYFSKNKEIGFSGTEINITGLVPQKTTWSALNNVVIRDGMLTMDYKNNTVFQAFTDEGYNEDYDVEDDEFNAYCAEQLRKTP